VCVSTLPTYNTSASRTDDGCADLSRGRELTRVRDEDLRAREDRPTYGKLATCGVDCKA
jgi:hypothetical protein